MTIYNQHRNVASGIVRLIHEPHPFALRATGPTCGCPILFQTKLSNRWVLIPVVTTKKAKRPTRGRFAFLAERVGFEPTVVLPLRQFSRLLP
jgi:hypothetical protein